MSEINKLTKTCSSCGQEKPLSAFLMLTEHEGAGYGEICVTCRSKAAAEKASQQQEEGGSRRHTDQHNLGASAHLAGESEKEKLLSSQEEEYHSERQRRSTASMFGQIQKQIKQEQESKIKKGILEKNSFLTEPKKQEEKLSEQERQIAPDQKVDYQHTQIDKQITGKIKNTNARYFEVLTRLGKLAPKEAQKTATAAIEKARHEQQTKTVYQRAKDLFSKPTDATRRSQTPTEKEKETSSFGRKR